MMILNSNEKIFRALIIVNVLFYLSALTLPYIDGSWLTEKELDVLSYLGYEALIVLPSFAHWFILISWFSIILAMYFFVPVSRLFFLAWLVLTTMLVIVSGMNVMTSLDAFHSDMGNILDGVILSMAYFSGVSQRFFKKS